MNNKTSKKPRPMTKKDALKEILLISKDRRGRLLLSDQCNWLEHKIAAMGKIASRALKT